MKIDNSNLKLKTDKGNFSFTTLAELVGWFNMSFATFFNKNVVKLERDFYKYKLIQKTEHGEDVLGKYKKITLCYSNRKNYPDEEIIFWLYKNFLIFQHNILNNLDRKIMLKKTIDFYAAKKGGIKLGSNLDDIFFCHVQNLKEEDSRYGSIERYNFIRSIKGVRITLNDSEDLPFPAVFFGNRNNKYGLIDASFSQNVRYRHIKIEGISSKYIDGITVYNPEMKTIGVDKLPINPGGKYEGEKIYLEILNTNDIQKAFDNYIENLSKSYKFRGKITSLQKNAIWGSWNYGIFEDINEELILKNSKFIKENFSEIKWIQIDHGYQAQIPGVTKKDENPIIRGIDFFYEGRENSIDKSKFPNGMKYVADKIKELGLKPAIWIGLCINKNSSLAIEHPEWILKRKNGEEISFCDIAYPDISIPEIRKLIEEVFKVLIKEWGFEGIKLDFWTFLFEIKNIKYRNNEKSSLEWRRWLLSYIRFLLPEDGYLEVATSALYGNPFPGIYIDNYRCSQDIGNGSWNEIKNSIRWISPLMCIEGKKTFLTNFDSIGINKKNTKEENRFWLSFCMMARSLIEVGCDLTTLSKEEISDLKKVLSTIDNGKRVYFGDFGINTRYLPPRIMWFDNNNKKYIGLFNFDDSYPKEISFNLEDVGLSNNKKYELKEFWTGEKLKVNKGYIEIIVPSRCAKIYTR